MQGKEMKNISYEAKLINGIPTLSELDIEVILHNNTGRKVAITRQSILIHLETLRNDYAQSLKKVKFASSQSGPCMGLDGMCGSTNFIRTGTCYTCLNCSTPQGCS